ncbi:unnamed protein product [Phytophthora fragariaefolia]|uniref:Unnamed protein product n=1 Tax=Phytophthora fragariaefolia TaxID=1490495 RepID=A0A9W6YEK4_9STRA|nr:unnamed protein product [Phytophthora fragariaefolia]
MRLVQVVILVFAALFARGAAIADTNAVVSTTVETARNLLSFDDVDSEPKPANEERVSAGAKAAAEGGRAGAGGTVVSSNADGGGTVTVTIYNDNGLWQKIKRWFGEDYVR